MKKTISVLLVVCILFCNLVLAVSAETVGGSEAEQKYSIALQNKISELQPDDTLNLALWLSYDTTIDYGFSEADFDDSQQYLEKKRAAEKQFYTDNNNRYAKTLASSVSLSVNYISKFTPSVLISVVASDVAKIAKFDFVSFIDYLSCEPLDSPTDSGTNLYRLKFESWLGLPEFDPELNSWTYGTYSDYEELYYHFSEQGAAPDWVLIKVHVDMYNLWEKISYKKVGDRVLVSWRSGADSFPYELAIYSATDESFYDVNSSYVTSENFKGLKEAVSDLELGYQMGDADMDGTIDICDTTVIQRCLVQMKPPMGNAYNEVVSVIGDLDGNGLDIVDATCIQRFIARMDNPVG